MSQMWLVTLRLTRQRVMHALCEGWRRLRPLVFLPPVGLNL